MKSRALRFVLMIGVVSFFADWVYEGARSVTGPFLAVLGASGLLVGFIAGLGELLGYGLRLISGRVSERTQEFWPITLFGYVVQMCAVPLLAWAPNWQIAGLLIVGERVGKAIRNPPRDVMLSHAAKQIGLGYGFGLHEALDQAGDDQDGDGTEKELHSFGTGAGERVSPPQQTGEEQALSDTKSGAAGDKDGGQFEHTVGSDKAPEL